MNVRMLCHFRAEIFFLFAWTQNQTHRRDAKFELIEFLTLTEEKKAATFSHCGFIKLVGPPRVELGTNGLCLPTTVFTALFRFVVWTVSCLYDLPVQSLHVLSIESFARDCHGFDTRGFPDFEQFY